MPFIARCYLSILFIISSNSASATNIQVAVASNFAPVIKKIVQQFEAKTAHTVTLIFGSTGRHYAQIKQGAPFDIYFSADSKRPKRLEQEGIAIAGSRFTYAIGKLVLWSPNPNLINGTSEVLGQRAFTHIALANPKLAPYGLAAKQVLDKLALWSTLRKKMVRGENIGQTFQFINSGNVTLGFVAYAQIKTLGSPIHGSVWYIPQSLYQPIRQQAVLLNNKEAAREFLRFIKSIEIQQLIEGFGYASLSANTKNNTITINTHSGKTDVYSR